MIKFVYISMLLTSVVLSGCASDDIPPHMDLICGSNTFHVTSDEFGTPQSVFLDGTSFHSKATFNPYTSMYQGWTLDHRYLLTFHHTPGYLPEYNANIIDSTKYITGVPRGGVIFNGGCSRADRITSDKINTAIGRGLNTLFTAGSHVQPNNDVSVSSYIRSNGTYVDSHMRSAPNGDTEDNWSHQGNTNPYTGKIGSKLD
ncbi:hypothetical protein [Citrobacter sp. Res13-Sevr-PEB04-36]|uniref:hypothetical protein n=1 Tax=Citrobacter sp. Res13-Sevr-PEB04-36 TaxID=2777960 RepID=UPI0018ACB49D|nr:hypothetical protein [Citrobacter sp. Res13-Sevr-PEB04-36]